MAGGIDQVSSALGELTAEVRNLNSNVAALFKKFDEHAKEDRDMLGAVKEQGARLDEVEHSQKNMKARVDSHEFLKQRVIGWGIGSAAIISGLGELFSHLWDAKK